MVQYTWHHWKKTLLLHHDSFLPRAHKLKYWSINTINLPKIKLKLKKTAAMGFLGKLKKKSRKNFEQNWYEPFSIFFLRKFLIYNFSKRNYCFYMLYLRHVMHIWSRLFGEFGNHIPDITLIIFQTGLILFTAWIHLQSLLCQGTFIKIWPQLTSGHWIQVNNFWT